MAGDLTKESLIDDAIFVDTALDIQGDAALDVESSSTGTPSSRKKKTKKKRKKEGNEAMESAMTKFSDAMDTFKKKNEVSPARQKRSKIIEAIHGIDSVHDDSLQLQRKRLVAALSNNIDAFLEDIGA